MTKSTRECNLFYGKFVQKRTYWRKTQVIPPPDVFDHYSQRTFVSIIEKIKDDPSRLNSRANRSLLEKKYICYLGITEKSRRSLLEIMVAEFEMAALPLNDGVLALALAVLRTNKIIDNDWQTNMNTRLDSLLSSWIRETKNPDLVRTLYSKYEIKMTIFWGRSINPFRAFRRNLPLVHIIPHLNY